MCVVCVCVCVCVVFVELLFFLQFSLRPLLYNCYKLKTPNVVTYNKTATCSGPQTVQLYQHSPNDVLAISGTTAPSADRNMQQFCNLKHLIGKFVRRFGGRFVLNTKLCPCNTTFPQNAVPLHINFPMYISLFHCYHITILPCQDITILPHYHFTMSAPYITTLSLYHISTLPCQHVTTIPRYHFTTLPLYHVTTLPHHHMTTLPLYHISTLPH